MNDQGAPRPAKPMLTARPRRMATGIALGLLGASLAGTVVLTVVGTAAFPMVELPWLIALTVALVGVRLWWARSPHREQYFWINLALAVAAVLLSPVFGLYLFIGYYESGLLERRAHRVTAMFITALGMAVAQTGGPGSQIFTPPFYAAFVAINVGITAVMMRLDRRREELLGELARTNEELRAEQGRTAALTAQLVDQARESGVSEERARLSREIHDTVAQDLVAIIAQLDALSDETDAGERNRRIGVVDSAARDALAEARRAVAALASPRLDAADLPLAVDDLLGQWRETTGLSAELTVRGRAVCSGHDEELLRVAQEALANVAKHARARRVDVSLMYAAAEVVLSVDDDGVGFDPEAVRSGFGLSGMRTRMSAIGGTLELHSTNDGTMLGVRVPIVPKQEDA